MLSNGYILILIWLASVGIFFRFINVYSVETVNGKKEYRMKFLPALILFLPIIFMAGFRDASVGDTYVYITNYQDIPGTIGGLINYLPSVSKDQGFTLLSGIIKMIAGNNAKIYLLILAAIQGIILVCVFRKYSADYLTAIFLFIASTDYISWMFNGIRQFTAVTIIFAATPLILKKKYIPLIVVILLAATIHASALLMLPVVFIVQGKAWNTKTILFIIASMVALVFVDQFTNVLDTLLADTQYTNVVSDWQSWNDNGTNAIRVLVYSVPAILSLIGKKYIDQADDPVVNVCSNMSIISMGLYIISIGTSGIMLGRLPIYVSLYGYIQMIWSINNMFTEKSAKLIKIAMILFYLAFYYYQMHLTWGII